MISDGIITWEEARNILKSRNISEPQFMEWLRQMDNGNSPQELLDVITHHLYHSTSEILVAPTHLQCKRIDNSLLLSAT